MNISEAVQVFVFIYVLVMAGLYLAWRFWRPLLAKVRQPKGIAGPVQVPDPSLIPGAGPSSYPVSYRPGAPRPPRLLRPPVLGSDDPSALQEYRLRLGEATRLVGYVAAANPTGFPIGLYREWHEARWRPDGDSAGIDSGQAIVVDLRGPIEDEAAYASAVKRFAASASYAEMADIVHFCGEAFIASKAGSEVRNRIIALTDGLAVAVSYSGSESAPADEHDRMMLERKLEVDFLADRDAKVSHLRRMHVFFRTRLIALRDDASAERRAERMADCRRHMEEHERLLRWLDAQP